MVCTLYFKVYICCQSSKKLQMFNPLVSGSGLEDINGVFEESNTYQPSVPSNEAEIIVSYL